MKTRRSGRSGIAGLALLIGISAGCGSSGGEGPSLAEIPRYPNAVEGESVAGASPGGMMSGSLVQFTTSDSFDRVLEFYTDALSGYDPQILSHTSELGRQTAFSIPQEGGGTTVVIQEFTEEGSVNITLMAVGG